MLFSPRSTRARSPALMFARYVASVIGTPSSTARRVVVSTPSRSVCSAGSLVSTVTWRVLAAEWGGRDCTASRDRTLARRHVDPHDRASPRRRLDRQPPANLVGALAHPDDAQ